MGKYIAKTVLILFVMINCTLAGCSVIEEIQLHDQLAILPDEPVKEEERAERVGVYVDVTPSMMGFLGMQTEGYRELVPETRYISCLNEINEIIAVKFDAQQITNYRIDTPLWQTQENVLEKAREVNYYKNSAFYQKDYLLVDLIENDGDGYDSLCLTNALLNCVNDDFSIIITDFYENNRADAEVIEALKKNVDTEMPNGKTVGFIGVKSEFAGKIYDMSTFGEEVEYGVVKGDPTEADIVYRQFFVLVLGYPEMVKDFCKSLQGNMNLNNDNLQYTVFHENQIYGLDYASFNQCYSRSNDRESKLWPSENIKINNSELEVYEYVNSTGKDKDIVVSYTVKGETLITELNQGMFQTVDLPDLQEKELIEVPCFLREREVGTWNPDLERYEANLKYAESFYIKKVYYSPQENLLYVWFAITGNQLPSMPMKLYGKIYLESAGNLHDDWIWEWNLENGDGNFEKTKNLKKYAEAIKERMPEKEPLLLEFSFYINSL